MNYPLKMKPEFKETLWGGTNLSSLFGKDIRSEKTAESWELAVHPNGISTVANGKHIGKKLDWLITHRNKILGSSCRRLETFPLLFKLIDANDKLSVQVHPNDEIANELENYPYGKTEAWYVVSAKPGAKIVYGFKQGVTQADFEASINEGTLESLLNYVDCKEGDLFFIEAGTVHAIGEGLVIAELQQNCDTTYRVFDYNRVDSEGNKRELHVEKALRAANVEYIGNAGTTGVTYYCKDVIKTLLCACESFAIEKITTFKRRRERSDKTRFQIVFILSGSGVIVSDGGMTPFSAGDTFLIPAVMGKYVLTAPCTYLKMYVPNLKVIQRKIKDCDPAQVANILKLDPALSILERDGFNV